ncbi:SgcJ/EcaC family oxidoreductase [soil metagenome]
MKLKIFVITIIMLSAAINLFAQEKISRTSKDEAAIRANVEQMETGWNAHDGKAFAAPFAEDADYVVVNGMHTKGKDAIEKGHTGIFTTIYKDSRNAATIKSIRFLRKDIAVAHVEWSLEFRVGGEMKRGNAISTMIMIKDNGKWSIAAFQNTPIQPQGGN